MKFCDRLLDEIVNHRGSIKELLESGKWQSGPCNVTQCVCMEGEGAGEGVV